MQFPLPTCPPTQILDRVWTPLPHETEHALHSDQKSHRPPHGPGEQISVWADDPIHLSFPDLAHFRCRLRVPLPHDTVQVFHWPHSTHCEHVGSEHVWYWAETPEHTACALIPPMHLRLRILVESLPHVALQEPQLAHCAQPCDVQALWLHVLISPSGPLQPSHIRKRHWIPENKVIRGYLGSNTG